MNYICVLFVIIVYTCMAEIVSRSQGYGHNYESYKINVNDSFLLSDSLCIFIYVESVLLNLWNLPFDWPCSQIVPTLIIGLAT